MVRSFACTTVTVLKFKMIMQVIQNGFFCIKKQGVNCGAELHSCSALWVYPREQPRAKWRTLKSLIGDCFEGLSSDPSPPLAKCHNHHISVRN